MINIKQVLEGVAEMKANLSARGVGFDLDQFLYLYDTVKTQKQSLEEMQRKLNAISKTIRNNPLKNEFQYEHSEASTLKGDVLRAKESYNVLLEEFDLLSRQLPNWTSPDVPVGESDEDNLTIKFKGQAPKFGFCHKDHVQLGQELDLIDFDSGRKVSGAKFYCLKKSSGFSPACA
ncbi:hypothetical protein [Pseudomonas sp. RL_105y_Pfl2_101]|uniref:hypothetical protein n=1 Tax=Pseudomonas sp. RL_105y_Pfl2_101 TaxID=3088708 RepID=UPI0030D7CA88